MQSLSIPDLTGGGLDWSSLCWVALLACITAAVMWIKSAYPRLAKAGAAARVLANVAISYFGVGMTAFGVAAVLSARFPVPGGTAWEGSVAIVGGLAACLIGVTTVGEHVARVMAMSRTTVESGERELAPATRTTNG